jgi:hypothetical protein
VRYSINIERAAKFTVIENRRDGPRWGKWKPFRLARHSFWK